MARASARLWSEPSETARLAAKAAALRPRAIQAETLRAHALLLLEKPQDAHRLFSEVAPDLSAPSLAVLSPVHVLGGARAALLSGDYQAALMRYRWVLLRLDSFHHPRQEARVLIEAATAASYAGPGNGQEARAYLSSAVRKNAPLLRPIAHAAWALSLWREGLTKRASKHAGTFEDSWGILWIFDERKSPKGLPSELLPLLPPGEEHGFALALAALIEPEAVSIHREHFEEEASSLPQHLKAR